MKVKISESKLNKIISQAIKEAITKSSRKLVKHAMIDEAHCTGSGGGTPEFGHCY